MLRLASSSYRVAMVLSPLVGMGIVSLWTGRSLGTGIQPAFLPLVASLFLLVVVWARDRELRARLSSTSEDGWAVFLAVGWILLTTTWTWQLDSIGLAGEVPWWKAQKQAWMLLFFVAVAVAPVWIAAACADRRRWIRNFEAALSWGLVLAVAAALIQLLEFRWGAAFPRLDDWFSSNPSIASGSEELYLGHQFVGIARARGSFPEPLHLGSFLVAVLPVTACAAYFRSGWERRWRLITVALGMGVLVLTFSRGAYLGMGAAAVGAIVEMVRGELPRPSGKVTAIGSVAILAAGIWGLSAVMGVAPLRVPTLVVDRLLQSLADHDMSNLTRFYAWEAAWKLFLHHPLAGVGWGSFGFHYYQVAPPGGAGAHFGWPMANSLPLLVVCETGLVGTGLAARAMWPALRALGGGSRRRGRSCEERAMCTVLALSLCGVLVHALTFSQWNLPHLWILIGFSAAANLPPTEVV